MLYLNNDKDKPIKGAGIIFYEKNLEDINILLNYKNDYFCDFGGPVFEYKEDKLHTLVAKVVVDSINDLSEKKSLENHIAESLKFFDCVYNKLYSYLIYFVDISIITKLDIKIKLYKTSINTFLNPLYQCKLNKKLRDKSIVIKLSEIRKQNQLAYSFFNE
jgi:hypothetical protein